MYLYTFFILCLCTWSSAVAFHKTFVPRCALKPKGNPQVQTPLKMVSDPSLLLSAVLDYSAEIEASVGTEIYSPIFKAGLTLFASGILAAVAAAFIISKADTYGDLVDEFERGKEGQLIYSEMPDTVNMNPAIMVEGSEVAPTATEQKDIKGLDL